MFERSRHFFKEFNAIFARHRDEAAAKYTDNTAFTDFIVGKINDVIHSMGACPQNEYFRIDASGYTSRYGEPKTVKGFHGHCWDLEIAVEHENDPSDWLDEVVKLAHICCPLRVVIGYVPMGLRPAEDRVRLDCAADALRQLVCRDNVRRGEFMVILGNSCTKGNPENFFHYRAYALDPATFRFTELEEPYE